jgi:HEAT repeat protein
VGLFWRRPPKVEKLKRAANVEGLVRALRYEDPIHDRDGRLVDLGTPVREAAAAALAEMDGPEVRDGLMQALQDPEESVRATTILALRERGGAAGVEPLVWAVTSWTEPQRAQARGEALDALVAMRDPAAPQLAVAQMLTRPEELNEPDAVALRRLADAGGEEAVSAAVGDLVVALRDSAAPGRAGALLVVLAPHSVDPLIGLLEDPRVCEQAALALGSIHDSSAVDPLCTLLLEADDGATRRAAAWALGEIRDPAAVEALLVATGDRDYEVRAAAITGFDNLGNAAIAVAMSALLRPALENGNRPAAEMEQPAEAAAHGPETTVLPPLAERPTRQSAQPSLPLRAGPALRRLLGRHRLD